MTVHAAPISSPLSLPKVALSVRQPWAWALIHAAKDVENRDWGSEYPASGFRGAVAIHASQGMTRSEYEEAREFIASIGVECPLPHLLVRGAIIGVARVLGFVDYSPSRWFCGPSALVMADATPCARPVPAVGALGFFKWSPAPEDVMREPSRWMRPEHYDPPPVTVTPAEGVGDLTPWTAEQLAKLSLFRGDQEYGHAKEAADRGWSARMIAELIGMPYAETAESAHAHDD
jgi:hypothetical protein